MGKQRTIDVIVDEFRAGLLDGSWTPLDSAEEIRMSSNPDALMRGFERALREPIVRAAFDAMLARELQH